MTVPEAPASLEEAALRRMMLTELAQRCENNHPCKCQSLLGGSTASGHKHGCPVDAAARAELAARGIP